MLIPHRVRVRELLESGGAHLRVRVGEDEPRTLGGFPSGSGSHSRFGGRIDALALPGRSSDARGNWDLLRWESFNGRMFGRWVDLNGGQDHRRG